MVAAVEVEPFGEATMAVEGAVAVGVAVALVEGDDVEDWMLAVLLRLEPKPRLLKRELMTSTSERSVRVVGSCDGAQYRSFQVRGG